MTDQKKTRPLLIMFLIFAALVILVFLTQKKEPINWVLDYQTGMDLAKQQNKPALLAFIKLGSSMYTSMANNTYKNAVVKKFIEQNFVPILIDVDKQPDIAKKYNIDYYPTHFAIDPKTSKTSETTRGYDTPSVFMEKLKLFLDQLKK